MPLPPLLRVLLILQAAAPLPKHTWIADLKANRASLGKADIQVEGDVVDIRSTSPTAKFGFYRLIDASDPGGLLVRTARLPKDGGAFRLRARLAAEQPPDGSLLLDELERSRTDKPPVAPLALAVLSVLSLITFGGLLVRAVVEERRYNVSPPLWLLPEAGPYGKSGAAPGTYVPSLKYSPDLEEADRQQRERLGKQRRNLFQLTLGALVVSGACGAWVRATRPAAAQVPAFVFIEANGLPIPARNSPTPGGDTALALGPLSPTDSIRLAMLLAFRESAAGHQTASNGPVAGLRRRDSSRVIPPVTAPPPQVIGAVDTAPVAVLPPTPPPSPPPPPPTPPSPVADSTPPARDPEVERSRAADVLSQAANTLVAAINGRKMASLALLLPEALAGDLGRRERLTRLVRDLGPRATLGTVEPVILAEDRAEARFAVSFSWRGDFGVDRRKSGRFLGIMRRETTGWRFQGAQLLDAVP